MRINFNTLGLGIGGGNRVTLELASELGKRHDVTVTAVAPKNSSWWFHSSNVKVNFVYPSVGCRLLKQRLMKKNFLDVQRNLLKAVIPDCDVNVATFCLTAKPTVESEKGKPYYLVQNFEPWIFPEGSEHAKTALESYCLPLTRLCVSHWLAEKVKGMYVGNGVNKRVFHLDRIFKKKKPLSVLYLYRGISWKNDPLAIETLTRLYKVNPHVKIFIVKRRKQALPAVGFPFKVFSDPNDDELRELYSMVRVLLFTSMFEGFGLQPLEALACKTNVVSTDFKGNEYLRHGFNCYLANNPVSLADYVNRLLRNNAVAQEQIKNGQQAVNYYSFERMAKRMEHIFESGKSM